MLNKEAKSKLLGVFIFVLALSVLFLSSYVTAAFAAHHPPPEGQSVAISINDDEDSFINITLNNTMGNNDNITNVIVNLSVEQAIINFTNDSFVSNVTGVFANFTGFNQTGTQLLNFSGSNISSLVTSNLTYIGFNVTAVVPGNYNISVEMANITGANESIMNNLSIHVNDTFTVEVNGTGGTNVDYANVSFLFLANYTLVGNETGVSINVSIWNKSNIMQSNTTLINGSYSAGNAFIVNWSDEACTGCNGTLVDGVYFINLTQANGTNLDEGNISKTGIRVYLDATPPSNIVNGTTTSGNLTNISVGNIIVNFTASDNLNISNIIVRLSNKNNGTVVNSSVSDFNNGSFWFNFTGMSDGTYTFNATVNDTANNVNNSVTKTITVDTTIPSSIVNGTTTSGNLTNISVANIIVNFTATDNLNISNIIVKLHNTTANNLINSSVSDFNNGSFWFNFTGMADGTYTFNATVNDTANNVNNSVISTITVDTTIPATIALGATTSGNLTNISVASVIVNVTAADALNISNIIVRLLNATGIINSSVSDFNNGSFWFNFTGMSDGTYTFNATVNDTANNVNDSITETITVDTTIPATIALGATTEEDSSNFSVANIIVNFTATDNLNISNIIVRLHNNTGDVINSSVSDFNNKSFWFNFTGISDGTYTFNATVNDSANNVNDSITRTVTMDSTAPVVTVSQHTDTSKIQIVLTVSVVDATGVNGSCSVDNSDASVTGSNVSQTITHASLSCGQNFTYVVDCTDFAGNNGAAASFNGGTDKCSGGSSSSGGGGGGSSSTWTNTYSYNNEELAVKGSVTRELRQKNRVTVKVGGKTHQVGIRAGGIDIANSRVTIEVSSAPQTATLDIGKTAKFDVTDNGRYDLSVTLNSVVGSRASLTITPIDELAPAAQPAAQPSGEQEEPAPSAPSAPSTDQSPSGGRAGVAVLWIIIILIIVAVIVFFVVRAKNRK